MKAFTILHALTASRTTNFVTLPYEIKSYMEDRGSLLSWNNSLSEILLQECVSGASSLRTRSSPRFIGASQPWIYKDPNQLPPLMSSLLVKQLTHCCWTLFHNLHQSHWANITSEYRGRSYCSSICLGPVQLSLLRCIYSVVFDFPPRKVRSTSFWWVVRGRLVLWYFKFFSSHDLLRSRGVTFDA
jgi:hypothetical protein